MNEIRPASMAETALLAAFRAAWSEYATSPLYEAEDVAYA